MQTTYNTIPALTPMLSMFNTIVGNIETLTNEHNAALCWRDEMHAIFDDGLDYDEVVALNISKDDLLAFLQTQKLVRQLTPKNPNCQLNGAQMTPYVQTFGIVGGWFLISLHIAI